MTALASKDWPVRAEQRSDDTSSNVTFFPAGQWEEESEGHEAMQEVPGHPMRLVSSFISADKFRLPLLERYLNYSLAGSAGLHPDPLGWLSTTSRRSEELSVLVERLIEDSASHLLLLSGVARNDAELWQEMFRTPDPQGVSSAWRATISKVRSQEHEGFEFWANEDD